MRRGESLNERHLKVEKTRLGRPPGDYLFRFDDTDFTFSYLGESETRARAIAMPPPRNAPGYFSQRMRARPTPSRR